MATVLSLNVSFNQRTPECRPWRWSPALCSRGLMILQPLPQALAETIVGSLAEFHEQEAGEKEKARRSRAFSRISVFISRSFAVHMSHPLKARSMRSAPPRTLSDRIVPCRVICMALRASCIIPAPRCHRLQVALRRGIAGS